MPRRRQSVAPQNEIEVLRNEIAQLRAQIQAMQQPGATTLQTIDKDKYIDPTHGEVNIHYPGDHVEAQPDDPIVYWHEGDAIVPQGWKGLRPPPPDALSWVRATHEGGRIRPAGLGDWYYEGYQTSTWEDSDATHLALMTSNDIPHIAGPGVYYVTADARPYSGGLDQNAHVWNQILVFDTGNAIDYASGQGTGPSYDWRWSNSDPSGVGAGAGWGPLGISVRNTLSGSVWANVSDLAWPGHEDNIYAGVSGLLYVRNLVEGKAVPIQVNIASAFALPSQVQVTQRFACQISVTRLGSVRGNVNAYL